MSTKELGEKYVALCKQGKFEACLEELFAKDAVSVEAVAMQGNERAAKGLDAIKAKGKTWNEMHTVHEAQVFGPYPHDDRFAVRFLFDVTNKPSGQRIKMDEIGVFTVANGKIVKEEFFYST